MSTIPVIQSVDRGAPVAHRSVRAALVQMPFASAEMPSIQIGLLAALARRAGFRCDTLHLNLELAARMSDCYESISEHFDRMSGEWLFAVAAATDGLDGFLAKRCGWMSELGKILDPLADKILLVGVFLTLGIMGLVPL